MSAGAGSGGASGAGGSGAGRCAGGAGVPAGGASSPFRIRSASAATSGSGGSSSSCCRIWCTTSAWRSAPGASPATASALDESLRRPGIRRVECRQPAPPEDRAAAVLTRGRAGRGGLDQGAVVGRDPLARLVGPAGEVRHARQMEIPQERAGVQSRRLLERAGCPRRLEGREIHLDQLRIESQVAGAEDRILGAELLAQRVKGLVETPAGALLVHITPQQSRQTVAAHPAISGASQDRQDGEPARLLCVPAQRARTVERGQAAERLDALHQ